MNGLLVLLFVWTLTEEATVTVQVADGVCTAVLGARHSEIPCGELGYVGLYVNNQPSWQHNGPLDWLAPHTVWRDVYWQDGTAPLTRLSFPPTVSWRRVLGEWRYDEDEGVIHWPLPHSGDFMLQGVLRRPYQRAGILLLEADRDEGWLFVISGQTRQGTWWRWQNGQPMMPLQGIPFQKSALAQSQSLLRYLLRTHQAALLLLGLWVWLGKRKCAELNRTHGDFNEQEGIRRRWLLLLVAMAVTLAVTGTIASDVLQQIPHVQDSVTYLFQAETLARGRLWAPAPAEPDFFEQEFLLVRDGRWFGKYPPGYPLLLALGVLADMTWLVNPILAMLTVLLFYLLGRELYDWQVGLWATLLLMTSPFFLFMSGSMMVHAAELFWAVLAMWTWLQAIRCQSWSWLILAGLALGMLFLTRQITAVLVAITFMAVIGWQTADWRHLFKQLGGLAGIVGIFVLLLLAYQTAVTGSPFTDPRLLYWPYDKLGFGDVVGEPENAFTVSVLEGNFATIWYTDSEQPPRGHTVDRGLFNTERNWRSLMENLFGWPPLLTLVFVWSLWLCWRPTLPDVALLSLLVATVGAYVAFWAAGIMYGPHYYYAALPALVLLTARGIVVMQTEANGRIARRLVTGLVLVLLTGNLGLNMPRQWAQHWGYNFVERPDLSALATITEPTIVFVPGEGDWWEYGRFFTFNTPWLDGRFVFARDLGDEINGRLLAHFPNHKVVYWREDGESQNLRPLSVDN